MNPITKEVFTTKKSATQPKTVYVDAKNEIHDIVQDKQQQQDLKQAKLSTVPGPVIEPDAPGTVAKAKGRAKPIGIIEQNSDIGIIKKKVMDREGISKENLDAIIKMTSGDGRKLEGNIASAKLIQRIARGRLSRQRTDDAISAIARQAYEDKTKPEFLANIPEDKKADWDALTPQQQKQIFKNGSQDVKNEMIAELRNHAKGQGPLQSNYVKTLAKQEQDLKNVATTRTHWVEDDWNKQKSGLSKVIKKMASDENNTEAVLGNLMKTLDWIKEQDEKEAQKTGKRSSTKYNKFRLAVQKHLIYNGGIPEEVKIAVKKLQNVQSMKRWFMLEKKAQSAPSIPSAPSTPKRRASIMPRDKFETPNQPQFNDQNPNFTFGDFP
jgi:hypothetical protein